MKNFIVFCCLCLTATACAQTGIAAQAAVDAGVLKGRTYTNKLLGFSCEIPKGWMSFSELLDKSAAPKAATEHERSLLRGQGVLLAAIEFPEQFRNVPIYFVGSQQGFSSIGGMKSESLAIVAEPFPPGAAPDDLLVVLGPELDRQKSEDPKIQPAPHEELVIDGQKLLRTTFFSPKNSRYTSLLVSARGGYAMKFFLRSNSEKNLRKLMKVMETVHFDPSH
ncbi:MAG: hypothetical protein ABR920_18280 [Terriglobales bacterium]